MENIENMESSTYKISALRLRELLNERCMSAQELSNRSGVSKASISQYLSGKYTPKNTSAKKLADVFNVNPAWLMGLDVPKEDFDSFYGDALEQFPTYFNRASIDNNHAFLSEFDRDGNLLFLREITPRDMGRKWTTYEIEDFDIGQKITPRELFSFTNDKTEFEYIKEYISNFTKKELVTLSKYIDFELSARELIEDSDSPTQDNNL